MTIAIILFVVCIVFLGLYVGQRSENKTLKQEFRKDLLAISEESAKETVKHHRQIQETARARQLFNNLNNRHTQLCQKVAKLPKSTRQQIGVTDQALRHGKGFQNLTSK